MANNLERLSLQTEKARPDRNKALDLTGLSLYFAASLELDKGARHESSQLFEVTKRPSSRLSNCPP